MTFTSFFRQRSYKQNAYKLVPYTIGFAMVFEGINNQMK